MKENLKQRPFSVQLSGDKVRKREIISKGNNPCSGRDSNRGTIVYETLSFESRGREEGYGRIKEVTKQRKKQRK